MSKYTEQIELQKEIQKCDINLVTCGNCGLVLLHHCGLDDLECPHCGFEDDISSFPDVFFEGMEVDSE